MGWRKRNFFRKHFLSHRNWSMTLKPRLIRKSTHWNPSIVGGWDGACFPLEKYLESILNWLFLLQIHFQILMQILQKYLSLGWNEFEVLYLNHWQEQWSQGKQTHHLIALNKACSWEFRVLDGYRFKTDGLKAWINPRSWYFTDAYVITMLNTVPRTWQSMGTAPQPAYWQQHAAIWLLPTKPQLITIWHSVSLREMFFRRNQQKLQRKLEYKLIAACTDTQLWMHIPTIVNTHLFQPQPSGKNHKHIKCELWSTNQFCLGHY